MTNKTPEQVIAERIAELKTWVGAVEKQNHILKTSRGLGGATVHNTDQAMCSYCGANAGQIEKFFQTFAHQIQEIAEKRGYQKALSEINRGGVEIYETLTPPTK